MGNERDINACETAQGTRFYFSTDPRTGAARAAGERVVRVAPKLMANQRKAARQRG